MIISRIESHIEDPEMPPLEDGAMTAEPTERPSPRPSDMWKVRRRQRTNRDRSRSPSYIFTSNNGGDRNSRKINNAPRRRSLFGLNNGPRGSGLLQLNNALRGRDTSSSLRPETFLGRRRPLEMVMIDICSFSISNE